MDFFSRKLLSDDDDDDDRKKFCDSCSYYLPDHCPSDCLKKCSNPCSYLTFSIPPINSDEFNPTYASKSPHKLSNLVTATIALLSFTFLLVLCYAVYARFYSGRRRRRRDAPPPPPTTTHQQEFLDEEHGPDLDHPIWYIRTIGLPPAVIDAIAVCKFKSGEGLIDGTDCSVCLTEFEDDDTLRLLPKCNHAFHLPCIDTWLRSHTNCPMCRAPVVAQSSVVVPSSPPQPPLSEETQMGDMENLGESSVRNEEQEQDEIHSSVDDSEERVSDLQPMRRSVSLDSLTAVRISSVFAVGNEKMDNEAGEMGHNEWKKPSQGRANCSAAMNRSVSCSGKFLMRSSTQRSSGADQN